MGQLMTKRERITGIVLAALLLITIVNSTYYFLGIAGVSVNQWLVFNACAPSSIAYIIGLAVCLFTRDRMWLAVAVVPIFFFGTMGMFVFPWNGYNMMAQVSHILMTFNIAWALYVLLKYRDYKALGLGLLVSIIVFMPFITYTQVYCREHADEVMRVLGI